MAKPPKTDKNSTLPGQISLFSLGVFTMIVALLGLSAGYLFRAAGGNNEAMGTFILVISIAPLALLTVVSLLFQLLRLFFAK